jgi:hypothetical protein
LFTTSVAYTGGKFTAGVVDTGGNLPPASLTPHRWQILPPVSLTPTGGKFAKGINNAENGGKICRWCR